METLHLPEPLFDALKKAAESSGTTPVGWIAAQLQTTKNTEPIDAANVAEMFAGRLGRIHSGGQETLSENCGQKFGKHLAEKHTEHRS